MASCSFFMSAKKQLYWLCLANDLCGITNQRCREQVWAARCSPAFTCTKGYCVLSFDFLYYSDVCFEGSCVF